MALSSRRVCLHLQVRAVSTDLALISEGLGVSHPQTSLGARKLQGPSCDCWQQGSQVSTNFLLLRLNPHAHGSAASAHSHWTSHDSLRLPGALKAKLCTVTLRLFYFPSLSGAQCCFQSCVSLYYVLNTECRNRPENRAAASKGQTPKHYSSLDLPLLWHTVSLKC